jgi:hypothetical protein
LFGWRFKIEWSGSIPFLVGGSNEYGQNIMESAGSRLRLVEGRDGLRLVEPQLEEREQKEPAG